MLQPRKLMPAILSLMPLTACNCEENVFSRLPDAAQPPEGEQDAGPPPPQFPLGVGDRLVYPPPVLVTLHNDTLGGGPPEQSTTWQAQFTVEAPGPTLDPGTNSWVVPATYFWQVADQLRTVESDFLTLNLLWLTHFGPWQEATGASHSTQMNFRTDSPMLPTGAPETFPFFDLTSRFDAAAQAFQTYVQSLDAQARVRTQAAARTMEAGFLEPTDTTQLHVVTVIYHAMGFICQIDEAIGPWDPAKPKDNTGFRNNQRDYKSSMGTPRLTRAGGSVQYCRCGTGAGSDCM